MLKMLVRVASTLRQDAFHLMMIKFFAETPCYCNLGRVLGKVRATKLRRLVYQTCALSEKWVIQHMRLKSQSWPP